MFKLFKDVPMGSQFIADNGNGKPATYVKRIGTIYERDKAFGGNAFDYNAVDIKTESCHAFGEEEEVIVV